MKTSKGIVPIFFACDDKYVKFTMVTLKSIMENASKDYEYRVYILNTDIKEETKKKYAEGKLKKEKLDYIFAHAFDYLDWTINAIVQLWDIQIR